MILKINVISKSTGGKCELSNVDFNKEEIELKDGDVYKFSDIFEIDVVIHLVGGLKNSEEVESLK